MTIWNQKAVSLTLVCALLSSLPGCTHPQGGPSVPSEAPGAIPTAAPTAAPTPVPEPTPRPTEVLRPRPDGERTEKNEAGELDYSHAGDGYIMARAADTESRVKLWMNTPAMGEYTYDLAPGQWESFPLSGGSGNYSAVIFIQRSDGKYTPELTLDFEAVVEPPESPFLRPNQQVNYLDAPVTLKGAGELTKGCEDPMEAAEKVLAFLASAIQYDEEQAQSVESGYISHPDETLERGRGICLDYAAVMASMLRSVGIPCRLAVGEAGSLYHAWNEVWDGERWVRMDPTFAASGKDTAGVEYRVKFYY